MEPQPEVHRYEHRGLLGTMIEVRVAAESGDAADEVDVEIIAEISRLEQVFSAYEQSSELSRWRRIRSRFTANSRFRLLY